MYITRLGFLPAWDKWVVGSFFWLSSGMTLDLGKGVSYASSLGTPVILKSGYSILSEIFKIRTMYPEGKKNLLKPL